MFAGMRPWLLVLFVVGCAEPRPADIAHTPAPLAPAPSTAAAPTVAPGQAALTAAQACDHPPSGVTTIVAFLCEDRSAIRCPPCPAGANCGDCPDPVWLFCDSPNVVDWSKVLWVTNPSAVPVVVGRRYRLTGEMMSAPRFHLQTIQPAPPS
jgi:hypothetical protein